MKTSELKKLIEGNSVERIVLRSHAHELTPAPVWDVFCYDSRSEICRHFGEQLVNNDGSPKTYTSLDRARFAVRALGFKADITVEG
jgi:hypothetical protein